MLHKTASLRVKITTGSTTVLQYLSITRKKHSCVLLYDISVFRYTCYVLLKVIFKTEAELMDGIQ